MSALSPSASVVPRRMDPGPEVSALVGAPSSVSILPHGSWTPSSRGDQVNAFDHNLPGCGAVCPVGTRVKVSVPSVLAPPSSWSPHCSLALTPGVSADPQVQGLALRRNASASGQPHCGGPQAARTSGQQPANSGVPCPLLELMCCDDSQNQEGPNAGAAE